MDLPLLEDKDTLVAVLDGYPAPTLIVDDDVRAEYVNRAGRRALGLESPPELERALLTRGGHLLHCVHAAEVPEGCGRAPACRNCVIRSSVGKALSTDAVHRARAFLQLEAAGGVAEVHVLVSAAPVRARGRRLVVLTMEDVTDLVTLASLVPICFRCRKIRNEEHYWQTVEEYFKEKADIDFSHALCDECLEKYYPEDEEDGP